jgi:6-phosphogluconolactonase
MNLHLAPTPAELAQQIAGYLLQVSGKAVAERGRFTVALSGGSLPKLLAATAAEPFSGRIDWAAWHVFWADERCLPLTDPDSNYYLARQFLLDQVDIPTGQIYPIDPALVSEPAAAAKAYQAKLAEVFQPPAGQLPRFDLILLGMGEDGHTASLFPGHPLLVEKTLWMAPILNSPKPPPARITLTLPVINYARQVAFITTGAGKAEVLPQMLEPTTEPLLPAARVQPTAGELHWFVDAAAAANLKQ